MNLLPDIAVLRGLIADARDMQETIDKVELYLSTLPQADCSLKHVFAPGLYLRKVVFPKGTIATSKIHKTQHPFVVLSGKVSVFSNEYGEQVIEAPFTGMTYPGTRRLFYAHEDTEWMTIHATDKTDISEIEKETVEDTVNFRKELNT